MDSHHSCELPDFDAAATLSQKDFDELLSKIGPRTYTLKLPNNFNAEKARVFVIGCQGSGSEWQKKVAKLMNEVSLKSGEPLIIIVVGDNIYNTGAASPFDIKFLKQFFNIYYTKELPGINRVPSIVLIGNHDGNYDKKSAFANWYAPYTLGLVRQTVGWEIEKNEVLEGYLPTKTQSFAKQVEKFQQPVLHRDELSAWNMPYVYFSLILGKKEFFFVNSNSIFVDYLTYCDKIENDEKVNPLENQIAWLKERYDIAIKEGRMPILVSHHPADLTLGKRMHSFDAWHYTPRLADLNERLGIVPPTESFTEFFKRILIALNTPFPFKISAHDHFINYVNDPGSNACQLTMGASGGALHSFMKFNHPKSGCQLEQYGFAALTIPLNNDKPQDKVIDIDIYTIDGLHLKFDTTTHRSMRWEGTEEYEVLRSKIIALAKKFFDNIKLPVKEGATPLSSSFFTWGLKFTMKLLSNGIEAYEHMTKEYLKKEPGIVQDIVGYFDQFEPPTYHEALQFLRKKIEILESHPKTEQTFLESLRKAAPEVFVEVLVQVSKDFSMSLASQRFDD